MNYAAIGFLDEISKVANVATEEEARVELEELPAEAMSGSKITQGFLKEVKDKGTDVRIRSQDNKYTLTAKYRPKNQEAEMDISKEMFTNLWPTVSKPQIKTRFKINGWEIDKLEDGKIFAEYEFSKRRKGITVPNHWKVKKVIDDAERSIRVPAEASK